MEQDPKPTGNRTFTREEMRETFGGHPQADFKPRTTRKGRRKGWWKDLPPDPPREE